MDLQLPSWENTHLTFSVPLGGSRKRSHDSSAACFINTRVKIVRTFQKISSVIHIYKISNILPESELIFWSRRLPPHHFFLTHLIIPKNVISMMQRQANLLICLSHIKSPQNKLWRVCHQYLMPKDYFCLIFTQLFLPAIHSRSITRLYQGPFPPLDHWNNLTSIPEYCIQ